MGINIDGARDLVSAGDGSLTIEGFSINTSGIATFTGGVQVGTAATISSNGNATFSGITTAVNFKTGDSNLHNAGYTVGTALTISNTGNAAFAGIVTCNGGIAVGSTNIISEINTKATTGKAIAMAMIFG